MRVNKFRLIYTIWVVSALTVAARGVTPREAAMSIGDRLIRETPFRNRLVLNGADRRFDNIRIVDFARTYGDAPDSYAYAFTTLTSDGAFTLPVEFDHSGECRIYLNDSLIYSGFNGSKVKITHDERNITLSKNLELPLKAGQNRLLVKTGNAGGDWMFCIQPEPDKMQVGGNQPRRVEIGLNNVSGIDSRISEISNWLVCGPFDSKQANDDRGKAEVFNTSTFGRIYEGKSGKAVSWTLPHVELKADVIDPAEWGTPYNWNYHNGGTAWAMQKLSERTGETRYAQYADDFCNFHLGNLPTIRHQVEDLKIFDCTNHHIYKTPLLDFTLAPSLPFIYKLSGQGASEAPQEWKDWVAQMIDYSGEQIRYPGKSCYTRTTPEEYTTWVDDMFMGIPFLVHAYNYTGDRKYIDDALAQIDDFNKIVWDRDASLYMHAQYSNRKCKLPHWSRANGWGLWAVTEAMTYLPEKDPRFKSLLKHYKKHIANIAKYQSDSGLWYNVLEYPESREEVSGTAIFTMAIARGISRGWLDRKTYLPVVEKAWQGLQSRIDSDGNVHDICYGTMCSEDVNYYINRPFYTNDTHGLFAVLFACIELDELLKN